ncbi:hypothetical protein BX600DRAFT_202670 [Xylariales sp. PMI_506]|nr:hypothetical protein BX600DRAFT_202670 [Xylariales sp. PMI_506]
MFDQSTTDRHRSTYNNYPHLTNEEFAEACHHLDSKYCQATLGELRKQWKLRVQRSLDLSFGADSEYTTFVQITRPLEDTADDLNSLWSSLHQFSINEESMSSGPEFTFDAMSIGSDPEELVEKPMKPHFGYVTYEVHLHPTYRAPCLWFSLHDLPADEQAFDIDTVFRHLVPSQFKNVLRGVGPIGGISADVSSQ